MEIIRKGTQFIYRVIVFSCLIILIIASFLYMSCPVYRFDEPLQFCGESVFNPYEDIDPASWKKGNFHTHTIASDGVNTVSEVEEAYEKYGYELLAVTDHSRVTETRKVSDEEIPAYEHGLNLAVYHSVIIGASKGSLYDFPFYNTLSNKYHVLKMVKNEGDIVILAHPDKTRWLDPGDMKYISNYQMMELGYGLSAGELPFYDAALSNGHFSFVIAGDDCHNINNGRHFGVAATFVNTGNKKYSDVRDALLSGKNFAVVLPAFKNADYKLQRNLRLPVIEYLKVINDSIRFSVSEKAEIRIFGQNGRLEHSVRDTTSITVPFTTSDTYLRATAIFSDGVILYANPVVRYSGSLNRSQDLASINYPMTFVQTLFISTLVVVLFRLLLIILTAMLPKKVVIWTYRYRILITSRGKRLTTA